MVSGSEASVGGRGVEEGRGRVVGDVPLNAAHELEGLGVAAPVPSGARDVGEQGRAAAGAVEELEAPWAAMDAHRERLLLRRLLVRR